LFHLSDGGVQPLSVPHGLPLHRGLCHLQRCATLPRSDHDIAARLERVARCLWGLSVRGVLAEQLDPVLSSEPRRCCLVATPQDQRSTLWAYCSDSSMIDKVGAE